MLQKLLAYWLVGVIVIGWRRYNWADNQHGIWWLKLWSERPTRLNSTQLVVELSWVESDHKYVHSASGLRLTTTEIDKIRPVFARRGVLNMFRILRLSWVESDRALWTETSQSWPSFLLLTNSSLPGLGFSITIKTTRRIEGRRHWLWLEFLRLSGVERKEVVAKKRG